LLLWKSGIHKMAKSVYLSDIVQSPYFKEFSQEFANAIVLPPTTKASGTANPIPSTSNVKDGTLTAIIVFFLMFLFGTRYHGSYASRTFFGFKH
jgi:hypothetical protein